MQINSILALWVLIELDTDAQILSCGNDREIMPGDRVVIQSPGHPVYGRPIRCTSAVTCVPEDSSRLRISCPQFDLDGRTDGACRKDIFTLGIRPGYSARTITSHCGRRFVKRNFTPTGYLRMSFKSDRQHGGNLGFRCAISCSNKPTSAPTTTTIAPTT